MRLDPAIGPALARGRPRIWLGLCLIGAMVPGSAQAEIYSWVDEAGTIHFSDIRKDQARAPGYTIVRGDDADGFGGQPPLVIHLSGKGQAPAELVEVQGEAAHPLVRGGGLDRRQREGSGGMASSPASGGPNHPWPRPPSSSLLDILGF